MKPIPKPSITEVFFHYGATVVGSDRGSWQKATCALNDHDDRSPSASINESECKWHCWTCDKSGDAVDLVGANEGLPFREAVQFVLKTFGGEASDNNTNKSSLLPRGGSRQGRRNWTAPWTRL